MDQHRGKLSLPQRQPLHVIAEEKRAVELRYFCCINLDLFYKQKSVSGLEANTVTSDMIAVDLSLMFCKHWSTWAAF